MTRIRSINRLIIAVTATALFVFPPPATAQDDDDAIEINLDALESINPAREETPETPSAVPPATGDDETDESTPLLPPGVEDEQSKGPPELTPAPTPVLLQPDPQTPTAPRAPDLTVEKSDVPPALAARLKDRVDQLVFNQDDESLTLQGTEQLDSIIAQIADTSVRLELHAYAGKKKQSLTETKRLSLNRAIAVRGYLMGKGIDGTRIALRPKGPAPKDEAPERVDIHFLLP